MKWNLIIVLTLVIGFTCSVAGIVFTKHNSRLLFIELQELHEMRDLLNTEWGMLQLEQSTWATHGRIEKIARSKLGMVLTNSEEILVLEYD